MSVPAYTINGGSAAAGGADSIYSEAVPRVRNVLKVLVLPAPDGADADEVEVSDGDVEDLTAEPEATGQNLAYPWWCVRHRDLVCIK